MASWQHQLISRIIRTGDIQGVLDQGITEEDFTLSETIGFFQQILSYYRAPETEGSVWGPTALETKFPNFVLCDDKSMTTPALCYEVRTARAQVVIHQTLLAVDKILAHDPLRAIAEGIDAFEGQLDSLVSRVAAAGSREIFAPTTPIQFVVSDVGICPGAPGLLAGAGFSMKSLSAMQMLLEVTQGLPAWGRFPTTAGSVVFVDYEQGPRLTYTRFQRLAAGMGLAESDFDGRIRAVTDPDFHLEQPQAEFRLSKLCDGAVLCVIDSFRAACLGIDENSSDSRKPLDTLRKVSQRTNCAILVVHHATKSNAQGARASIRGSSAIFDAAGTALVLTAEKPSAVVSVAHVKERASGKLIEPFNLRVEERNAGIAVVATGTVQVASDLDGKITQALKQKGGPVSRNALFNLVRGNRSALLSAVAAMLQAGTLVEGDGGIALPADQGAGIPPEGESPAPAVRLVR